jgi:hypothetical protein
MRTPLVALKDLARGELEKGAREVHVFRLGQRTFMTRGRLPDLLVRGGPLPYLVCALRGEELRVYLCDGEGRVSFGDNLRGEEMLRFMKEVGACRRLFSLRKG